MRKEKNEKKKTMRPLTGGGQKQTSAQLESAKVYSETRGVVNAGFHYPLQRVGICVN